MKKLVLLIALLTFTFGFAKSENSIVNDEINSVIYNTNVNPFCKLIQMGDYDAVKALIEEGQDINQKSTGLTPLMFAARHNKVDIVTLLIKSGAKLKIKSDRGGYTALDYAKMSNATEAYDIIKKAMEMKKNKK
ncbi:ankyrin repeat domain-containing protein [Lutibacter sp. B1]|uniref:ankyrin repeat domain-containing protein n=1 Tax=Lutibacter sp. B1 TaxID=2725996 RepID=UPI0014576B3B|nr:ankyrin repeat domain-containing protein [Lutibacter sp. B1]NLP58520.1 ankyrin repeat domain-containing protein [Lutibacter sp. B1]